MASKQIFPHYLNFWRRTTINQAFSTYFGVFGSLIIMILILTSGSLRPVQAYDGSVTIYPVWDITAWHEQTVDVCVEESLYECDPSSISTLFTSTEIPLSCSDEAESSRVAMKFNLASIPNTARITSAKLTVNVSYPTTNSQIVRRLNDDEPDRLSCRTSTLFTALGEGQVYMTFNNWDSDGVKTADLGSTAVADIQQRIASSDFLALSIISNGDMVGGIGSVESLADKRPYLTVVYTLTPDPPTNFSLNNKTTTSINWTWNEQALFDTDNVLHDDNHAVVCTAGPRAGLNSPISCTETELQPNARYTRHPHTIDPDGATDGLPLSTYTAVETPSGVSFGSIESSRMAIGASGQLSNLRTGFSGVNLIETTTGLSSGWHQSGPWTLSGLRPNTAYTFVAQARNGEGEETPVSPSATRFTFSSEARAVAGRSAEVWYASNDFRFANEAGWGSGGIQYYRYAWSSSSDYKFSGAETTWSNVNTNCPGKKCTVANANLILTAPTDGSWYLHLQPYNGDDVPNGAVTYGPFLYDGTAPDVPGSAKITSHSRDNRFTHDLTKLTTSWDRVSDDVSGLKEYQYAIGTTPGATDIRDFTGVGRETNIEAGDVNLQDGVTYFVSVRAVDVAGNKSSVVTTAGILANTKSPRIIDRQAGDRQHRRLAGTRYNVDFIQAQTGPKLVSAQYAIYSKPNLGGRRLKNWTTIFQDQRSSYTANWRVDFSALLNGINYVSVRTVGLDGLVAQRKDVFTVVKDTAPAPHISGVLYSTFPQTNGKITIYILGRGFRRGAKVWVGSQQSRTTQLTTRGALIATVPAIKLTPGAYDLRVVNPNGLDFVRRHKIAIVPSL